MVKVHGQMSAPLLDMGAVTKEYWERKELLLPTLKNFMPEESKWFGLVKTKMTPKIVLRRLSTSDWESINERFYDLRETLAKRQPVLRTILSKIAEGEQPNKKERKILASAEESANPIFYAMLELMIIEPDLTYDEVVQLLNVVDDFDKKTLMSIVNAMTSEKASVMQRVYSERTDELNKIYDEVGVRP